MSFPYVDLDSGRLALELFSEYAGAPFARLVDTGGTMVDLSLEDMRRLKRWLNEHVPDLTWEELEDGTPVEVLIGSSVRPTLVYARDSTPSYCYSSTDPSSDAVDASGGHAKLLRAFKEVEK